jgi:hypothetical protein
MVWLGGQGGKWRSKLQSLKNGIIGMIMMSSVKERSEKLIWHWKSIKGEMTRRTEAGVVVVRRNIRRKETKLAGK